MAFKCENCGKHQSLGHRVSHAKNRTNHAFRPNIQMKRITVDGKSFRAKLCTNCIKTLQKVKKDRTKTPKPARIATQSVAGGVEAPVLASV